MERIEKTLGQFGLTAKEIKVFIALLKMGHVTVSALSRAVGLPRTTLYLLLESLEKREFIHKIRVHNHNEWEAIDPKALYRRTRDNTDDLKDSLPELEKIYGSSVGQSKPSEIIYYRSREGIKKAYEAIFKLNASERAYIIEGSRSTEAKVKVLRKGYILEWQNAFKKRGIILEAIIGERSLKVLDTVDKEVLQSHIGRMVIASILPDVLMNFDADIISFKDTVVIIIVSKDIAVFIHNHEIAEAFKSLFLIAEQVGKKIDLNTYVKNLLKEERT